jgi:hypothetical protein
MNRSRKVAVVSLALSLTAVAAFVLVQRDGNTVRRSAGVAGISEEQLTADFWISKLDDPDRVIVDTATIESQNARLYRLDESMFDLRALPANLSGEQVSGWIQLLADPPEKALFDASGKEIAGETLKLVVDNRNVEAVPALQDARYGLVVHRADLRTFPTTLRVFRSPDNSDIDRFQESALFHGTPVIIAHESADQRWWFVVSPRYAAWIEKAHVAEGVAEAVFGFVERVPYRIVTGATAKTVFTPEQPALSELQLDMGVRVPQLEDWAMDEPVNGQYPLSAHIIELPLRGSDGELEFSAALLQANADSAGHYLPLTRANIIQQGFKFLGERYGWGHSYNGRDCSGFVSEVYRSMGVQVPRNTSAQSVSPALQKRLFDEKDDAVERLAAVGKLEVGDLVYIPGHVMMVIGNVDGEPWVIHDTTGITIREAEGDMVRIPLNAVAVTPFVPLQFNESQRYVDRMTSIVRVASDSDKEASQPL